MFHLAKEFYRRGFFPTRVILEGIWLQAYFRIVGRENPQHIQAARSTTLGFIEGHTVARGGGGRDRGLRGVDRRADLARYPSDGPDAPRRRPAGLAGHRRTGGGRRRHRRPPRPDRGAGYHRGARRRGSTPAGSGATCCTGRPKRRRSGRWRTSTASTWLAASPTRTRSTTCRCCRWSGIPAPSTPTPGCWRTRRSRTGRSGTTGPAAGRPGWGWSGAAGAGATAGAVAHRPGRAPTAAGLSLGGQERRAADEQHHGRGDQVERDSRRSPGRPAPRRCRWAPQRGRRRPPRPPGRPARPPRRSTKPLSWSTSKRGSGTPVGCRRRSTSTVKPAKASRITARAQNTAQKNALRRWVRHS